MVAPLASVKSTSAVIDEIRISGCGVGMYEVQLASSRWKGCGSDPGPRTMRWPRFSW